jgi:hypothetical protein
VKLRNLAVALAVTGASACWTFGGSPVATGFTTSVTGSISVTTGRFPPPQVTLHSADDCKNGGWATSTNPVFTNQGDCVSHFTPAGGNGPKPATPAPAAATAAARPTTPTAPSTAAVDPAPAAPTTSASPVVAPAPAAPTTAAGSPAPDTGAAVPSAVPDAG